MLDVSLEMLMSVYNKIAADALIVSHSEMH